MRSTRIAVTAAVMGALALPVMAAPPANAAAPANVSATRPCDGSWAVHAKAVTIRAKASSHSTAVGTLYRSHKFTVHSTSGNWAHITDKTTDTEGWVSMTYVYPTVPLCPV